MQLPQTKARRRTATNPTISSHGILVKNSKKYYPPPPQWQLSSITKRHRIAEKFKRGLIRTTNLGISELTHSVAIQNKDRRGQILISSLFLLSKEQ